MRGAVAVSARRSRFQGTEGAALWRRDVVVETRRHECAAVPRGFDTGRRAAVAVSAHALTGSVGAAPGMTDEPQSLC